MVSRLPDPDQRWMQSPTSADDTALTRMHESSKSLNLIAQRLVVLSNRNNPTVELKLHEEIICEETLRFESRCKEILVCTKAGAEQKEPGRMHYAQDFDCR
ncbi:MAG: hypothetical protein IMF18_05800 [Proteobacteria bacterium]|nr:hypothetical protein [Pseudomonadota bacterium]